MERLGKNHGGYHGETIDIRAVLRDVEIAAQTHGWTSETFGSKVNSTCSPSIASHSQSSTPWRGEAERSRLNPQPGFT